MKTKKTTQPKVEVIKEGLKLVRQLRKQIAYITASYEKSIKRHEQAYMAMFKKNTALEAKIKKLKAKK